MPQLRAYRSRRVARFAAAAFSAMVVVGASLDAAASVLAAAAATPSPVATTSAAPAEGGAAAGPMGNRGRLDVGSYETNCYVPADGTVRCFGKAPRGDGAYFNSSTPTRALGISDAVQASTSFRNGCALRASGNVVCWGNNQLGQLGTGLAGSYRDLAAPTLVSGAIEMHTGDDFACALLGNGTVKCWGTNQFGSLGNGGAIGSGAYSATPVTVVGITSAVQLSVGGAHACVVLADGTARCWGYNNTLQLGGDVAAGTTATSTPIAVAGLSGIRAISAGFLHTCALLTNGTAKCWGDNSKGAIGDGATLPGGGVATPTTVVGLSGIAVIDAGAKHTCALLTSGGVRCWGANTSGQLGNGGTIDTSVPVAANVGPAVDVSAGDAATCAVMATGALNCWGLNEAGELGRRTAQAFPNPPGVVTGDLAPGEIQAGSGFSCALTMAEIVRCWGGGSLGQLGDGAYHSTAQATAVTVSGLSGVVAISAGTNHACAVTDTGRGYCWGDDTYGQLGNGHFGVGVKSNVPVVVVDGNGSALTDLVGISAGGSDTCAIRRTRSLVCWGRADDAQIGDGTTIGASPRPYASQVAGTGTYAGVSVGSRHVCALASDSTVWCWGDNSNKELGIGGNVFWTPTPMETSVNAVDVVARYQYTCALEYDGTVKCWGWSGYGVLGHPGLSDTATPNTVDNISTAVSIGPSSNHGVHTCAVLANGTAMCWGANDQGQLGDGSASADEATPVGVLGLTGAVQIAVGFQHTCALLDSGAAKCWGNNTAGQLGTTAGAAHPSPVTVTGFSAGVPAVAVDAGTSHTCAVLSNGTARCWGAGGSGRLGTGSTSNRTTPGTVSGLTGATAISAGGAHTCALVVAGTAKCWGSNAYGQLGNNSTTSHTTPVTVSGLAGAIAVSAGGNHSCALLSNGTVKCWGLNSSGQLGDGTTTSRHTPVTVKVSSTTALSGVVAITAGTSHTCAVLSNGTARCWGAGGSGRLGNGSTANKPYASTSVSGVTTSTTPSARFTSISAGGAHTCARIANGTARCWGSGASGRLGNASTASHSTPVTVSGLTAVAQISAGGSHTCALLSNGTARCWGWGTYGQLGVNSTSSHTTPVTVSGLSGATSISAGGNHTVALLGTGALRGWGLNSSGQVGDGTTTNRLTPRGVSGF
jgi:alpha-tubulin suppressor-like RCC1 family protein